MSAPAIVWIDERVAHGLPQAKDEELAERGVDQIRYVSQERVNELVQAAIGPSELIIQIVSLSWEDGDQAGSELVGLTSQGRLFMRASHYIAAFDGDPARTEWRWEIMDLPELES